MGRKCKCLIADDHPIIRKGVKDLVVDAGLCAAVSEAGSGEAVLAMVRQEPWDLLVLDVALPDKHGLEVLKEVKLLRPALPVLMLSLYPEREFAVRAIKAGASGYLTKDQTPVEFVTAVRQVLDGRRYITPSVANHLANHLTLRQSGIPHETLSDREMEVLRLLGQGKTVSEIAEDITLSVKTVSTYRSRLLKKLRLSTTAALVRYAIEHRLTT
ncbi:MAG: response regulator transcription factor [Nitrospira sp.]|nr:response regulator transcription factor [Nitrospira sp.]MDR4463388.1 response regulator transcription factor [Nitrospira sp.]MDR4467166.1 response regulator transcription factor [Nitrospira sp.]